MDITTKAQKVKAKRGELEAQFPSGDCVVVTVANDTFNTKGGAVMEAPVDLAARGIIDGTHRLATDEEVAAMRAGQEAARERIIAAQVGNPDLLKAILGKALNVPQPRNGK